MAGGSALTVVYLLLGLGLVGGLYYALTQITARQRRLDAELTRLERLAAEVTMNAEAILERVDERIDRLNAIAARVEAKVKAADAAPVDQSAPPVPAPVAAPTPAPVAAAEPPALAPEPAAEAAPEPEGARYDDRRTAVYALADLGRTAAEIAHELGVPRGEVQLLLNLRGRKSTA